MVFVFDSLIEEFSNDNRPITPDQYKFLGQQVKGRGVKREDILFVSAAPPAPKEVHDRDKAIGIHLMDYRDDFKKIVEWAKPKLIVSFGNQATRQTIGRSVKITKVRGQFIQSEEFGCPVLPVFGLFYTMKYPENVDILGMDMHTLSRCIANDYTPNYEVESEQDYKWVTDLQFIVDAMPEHLCVDTETVNLTTHDALDVFHPDTKILTVQFCYEAGKAYAVDIRNRESKTTKKLIRQLRQILTHPKIAKFGHNFKYDCHVLYQDLGIDIVNYEDDTQLLAHAIDENMKQKNQNECVKRWVREMAGYADEFDKDPVHHGKTRMDLVPPDKLLAYGCGDVDSCFRLRTRLRTLLHREGENPTRCYERITMPAQRAFLQIERHGGFPVSVGALKALQRYLVAEQERLYAKLVKPVPKYFIDTYSQDKRVVGKDGKPTKVKTFNVTRPVFLIDYMFKHKKGLRLTPRVFTGSTKNNPDPEKRVPSTSAKDHFPYFIADSEWVQDLTAYMKNQKMLSTYVGVEADEKGKPTGFFKYIRNGYIRPSYRLDGTTTGRPSSQNPNGQNFPKRGDAAKKFRRVFIAPPGWVYVSCDYAQIELKLAAMFAKAHSMLNLYKKGVDIHMATAAAVMKISLQAFKDLPKDVQSLARFRAKAVNFGFLYGMWWRKFREYAKTQYGVDYTDQEAEEIRRIFFQKYSELEDWYKQVESFVRRYGFVETATGRRRHLPSVRSNDEATAKAAVRQAINSPVQGTGSDLGLLAISRLYDDGICNDDFRVVGFIHDDIVCLAREKVAMKAVRILKRYMESNPLGDFGFKPEIKITAAPSIGYNLASLLELDDYGLTNKKHLTSVQDLIDEINKEEDEDRRSKILKELGKPHDESEFLEKPSARKRLRIRTAVKPKKRIIKLRRAA